MNTKAIAALCVMSAASLSMSLPDPARAAARTIKPFDCKTASARVERHAHGASSKAQVQVQKRERFDSIDAMYRGG
ncbi:hypothetical protein [Caballeronia sp. ATUFL_M2_KS44]|uniref:hypothetical protein n=1 Tax=Caballeronia sp. ATUFL_M2_KS44 TaxID=2921767 RepID=UPI002027C9B6|nr:hypothetical protein [Caballeronia sp. ATUFL_M2_KS44]